MYNKIISSVKVSRVADVPTLKETSIGFELGETISLSRFLEELYDYLCKLETDTQSRAVVASKAREFIHAIEEFQLVGEVTDLELDEEKMLEEEAELDNCDNDRVEERNVIDE